MNGTSGQSAFDRGQVYRSPQSGKVYRVRGVFPLPVGDAPADAVIGFLLANADSLGITPEAASLEMVQDVEAPTGRVVRFEQRLDGLPILGTEVQVVLDRSSHVRQIDLALQPVDRVARQVGDEKPLTAAAAVKLARQALFAPTLRQKVSTPRKVFFPAQEGLRLAYEVVILTKNPVHDWRLIVDAYTGAILSQQDNVWKVDGQGMVFDPNPVVTANNNTLRDPAATVATCGFAGTFQGTVDAERMARPLWDITLAGGKHKLEGPYVKLRDFDAPHVAPPEESSATGFDYASNLAGFKAVMVYYHVDTLQRYIQNTLGIGNANNRQTEADAHDNGTGGGYYSPADRGLHFGDSGDCHPNRAEDADCIYHEYNHAILDNVRPGYGPWGVANPITGRRESRAIGEGCGDILPCVYFAPDHPFQREVFEDWVFVPAGLRRVDGTKVYPADWVDEEHDDGEIWSAALWNIYRAIGGDTADLATRRAARDEMLKTMISSYFLLTVNPNMGDAAEAMLYTSAELPEYRLAHGIDMLNSFHDRGVLACTLGSDLRITDLWSQQSETPEAGWQQVEYGQDNWFYARVQNAGTVTARAAIVTFSFQCPYVTPIYPADWRDGIISAAVIRDLAPQATATVMARFPRERIPPLPEGASVLHGCILAEVYNPVDHAPAGCTHQGASNGKLYQRNSDVVDAAPGDTLDYEVAIGNYHILKEEVVHLEVVRPPEWEEAEVRFGHRDPRVIQGLFTGAGELEAHGLQPVGEEIGPTAELHVLDPARLLVPGFGDEPGLILTLARNSIVTVPRAAAAQRLRRAARGADQYRRNVEMVTFQGAEQMKLLSGPRLGFSHVMRPRERTVLHVYIQVPADATPGRQLKYAVEQRNEDGQFIGGFDITVNVVAG